MIKNARLALAACATLLLCLMATSCADKPSDNNQAEEILPNLIRLSLLEQDTSQIIQVAATWSDLDGTGGAAPVIDTLRLQHGRRYTGQITLTNQSRINGKDSTTNITQDVEKLSFQHQFFYLPSDTTRLQWIITDKDVNNLPVGLHYTLSAGAAPYTGSLRIILSHYAKSTDKNGTTRSPESDVDIVLPVKIE